MFYNFSLDWLSQGTDSLPPVSVNSFPEDSQQMSVYPVPSSNRVSVDMPNLRQLMVYSISGQFIAEYKQIDTIPYSIDVSSLASGVYLLKAVNQRGEVKMSQFVVGGKQ